MYQPFIGSIQYYAFNFSPKGWTNCAGQLLPINQYTALFSLLGVTYGGNGTTNFGLPDLRGRTILGQGGTYQMGQKAGSEGATIPQNAMPSHSHTGGIKAGANNTAGTTTNPSGAYPAVTGGRPAGKMYANAADPNSYLGAPASVTVGTTGAGAPFSTLSPYLALTCSIALVGIFPPRN